MARFLSCLSGFSTEKKWRDTGDAAHLMVAVRGSRTANPNKLAAKVENLLSVVGVSKDEASSVIGVGRTGRGMEAFGEIDVPLTQSMRRSLRSCDFVKV